jgi:hypothetical protein
MSRFSGGKKELFVEEKDNNNTLRVVEVSLSTS